MGKVLPWTQDPPTPCLLANPKIERSSTIPDKPDNKEPWHVMCEGPENPDQSHDLTFVKGWATRELAEVDAQWRNADAQKLSIASRYIVMDEASRVKA